MVVMCNQEVCGASAKDVSVLGMTGGGGGERGAGWRGASSTCALAGSCPHLHLRSALWRFCNLARALDPCVGFHTFHNSCVL